MTIDKLIEQVARRLLANDNREWRDEDEQEIWEDMTQVMRDALLKDAKQILSIDGLCLKVKCPECSWGDAKGVDFWCMAECSDCNSTGYTYISLKEAIKEVIDGNTSD